MRAQLCRLAALTSILFVLAASAAHAYTAAGDRVFPALMSLPQIAPTDEAYLQANTQPTADGRSTNLATAYSKTLTERWGIQVEGSYNWFDRKRASSVSGWNNSELSVRYLAVVDLEREFLLTVGVHQEFGGTGNRRVGADPEGATTPTLYFGKGLGDLDIGYLRPLAILGNVGYEAANGGARADRQVGGIAIQYSIPYLVSKVDSIQLPDFLRSMTPMVEISYATQTTGPGQSTAVTVAPGITYAGESWELGVEALVPATHAAGTGTGVMLQFHLSLDFLFPNSLGRPLFGAR
ncbi:MAG: hypothetical protein JO021_21685 [Alphaproteobacteria bacterium]|nr:hypothetical protein [Alphaproteobacteria bacterium]